MRIGIQPEEFKKRYRKLAEPAEIVEGMKSVKKTLEVEGQPLLF